MDLRELPPADMSESEEQEDRSQLSAMQPLRDPASIVKQSSITLPNEKLPTQVTPKVDFFLTAKSIGND